MTAESPMLEEPPVGATVRLGKPSLQAGWCYHRTAEGWLRVRYLGLDHGHPLSWGSLQSHHPSLEQTPVDDLIAEAAASRQCHLEAP